MKRIFFLLTLLMSIQIAYTQINDSIIQTKKENPLQIIKNSIITVPGDFGMMGNELKNHWKSSLIKTGIVTSLVVLDKPITTFYQESIEKNVHYSLPNISIGKNKIAWLSGNDAYLSYSAGGVYVAGLITNNANAQYAAINSFKALSYSILTSQLVFKTVFGRSRPYDDLAAGIPGNSNRTNNPYDFFNSRDGVYLKAANGGSSMPSLHATAFFAMAKVFQMEFDNYMIPYSVLAIVFCSDIDEHNHWVSDIVAGGLVGTFIGKSIVVNSWKKRGKHINNVNTNVNYQMQPILNSKFNGISLNATF